MKNTITQEYLKTILDYNPDTGLFHWKEKRGVRSGTRAGALASDGYRRISIDNRKMREHRLAFLYMTGEIPKCVDHKDGVRDNNSWENLRPANHMQNAWNKKTRSDNATGLKGVNKRPNGTFTALAKVGGKLKYLGNYPTPEEAHARYCEVAYERNPEFFRAA